MPLAAPVTIIVCKLIGYIPLQKFY